MKNKKNKCFPLSDLISLRHDNIQYNVIFISKRMSYIQFVMPPFSDWDLQKRARWCICYSHKYIYIFANNRKKYALVYQFIIPQIALTKLSCTPHMCPPVLQLMIYIWFQNLMFESFCIGFMDIGENVPLSGSHFSSAVDQFPLKNHIYAVGFFCLFYCFLSQPFNDDLNISLKEYILLLNNRKCISLRIAAPFWHN